MFTGPAFSHQGRSREFLSRDVNAFVATSISTLTLLVGRQEGHSTLENDLPTAAITWSRKKGRKTVVVVDVNVGYAFSP